ncbi:ELMO domain-containing protein 1-like protein [Leptotrombidium deliense]|uniref:ELMO domain-containing protein 1-like protein n=1 Tax=Leptotrombidium deliense TaxID=299467 RepID=A0A443SLT5_9ACAR|nr:ELMO domain-containing protein 1-like protein [Leptotrombidium deliense]
MNGRKISFLRRTTGLCELQRICYRHDKGAKRTLSVENSINLSRSKVIFKIREKLSSLSRTEGRFNSANKQEVAKLVEFAIEGICVEKTIKASVHQEFLVALRICFLQIYGYQQLIYDVNALKGELYDASDDTHEALLMSLWDNLMPDVSLTSRVSKQWTEIGFQGEDPKSDFRGMGLLGLKNLVYFSQHFASAARHILLHSNHPTQGYPFAITGINITFIAYNLLMSGQLKTHFFNTYFSTVIYFYTLIAFGSIRNRKM